MDEQNQTDAYPDDVEDVSTAPTGSGDAIRGTVSGGNPTESDLTSGGTGTTVSLGPEDVGGALGGGGGMTGRIGGRGTTGGTSSGEVGGSSVGAGVPPKPGTPAEDEGE